jgi:hypothetical protein
MFTSVQCEVHKGRYDDIVRDSQHYQLAQIAQATQPEAARSYKVLLASLRRRLGFNTQPASHSSELSAVPAPKRFA